MIGTAIATLVGSAIIPQNINESTKQQLKEEIQNEIVISQPRQESNYSSLIIVVIIGFIIGAIL